MSNLPIYEILFKETSNEDLSTKEKDEFMKIIKNIDQKGFEIAYALIRIFQLENNEDKSTFKIPYGGKFVKDDLNFNLNDLPSISICLGVNKSKPALGYFVAT